MTTRNLDPKMVELWLHRRLADRYGSVLHEALPAEWLALLKPPAEGS